MATVDSIAEVQTSVNSLLLGRISKFESQIKASPSSNITTFRSSDEFSNFRQHVWNIPSVLQQQLAEALKTVDMAGTRYRRKFLLLSRVPEQQSEDLPAHVLSLFQEKVKLDNIKPISLKSCRRLGNASDNKCRPIRIKFCDEDTKVAIWRKKSLLKGTSFVLAEFLTKQKQSWFMSARKHVGIRNVWTQNGSWFNGSMVEMSLNYRQETLREYTPKMNWTLYFNKFRVPPLNSSKPSLPGTELLRAESSRVKRVTAKKK